MVAGLRGIGDERTSIGKLLRRFQSSGTHARTAGDARRPKARVTVIPVGASVAVGAARKVLAEKQEKEEEEKEGEDEEEEKKEEKD